MDEKSGGTWIVPGSHKDLRNPRVPEDKISIVAPIPGEIQIKAKAGSVFVQDSRAWHSSALHNSSNNDRVAVVSRWTPWWVVADDYTSQNRYNPHCRPISSSEYLQLSEELKPLMVHLCKDEIELIQKPLLDRSQRSVESQKMTINKLKENKFDINVK